MKYSLAAVALAAVASAQTLADIPKCAKKCLDDAVTANTDCSTTDVPCICKDFSAVQGDATPCVIDACGPDVAVNEVLPAAKALCENAGNSSGGETSAAPTTAAETSAPAEETSAAEETTKAPETTAAQTSAPVEHTSAAQSDCSGMTTVKPTGTGSPAPTNGTASTMPAPTAGAAMMGSMGAIAMAALGALAL